MWADDSDISTVAARVGKKEIQSDEVWDVEMAACLVDWWDDKMAAWTAAYWVD